MNLSKTNPNANRTYQILCHIYRFRTCLKMAGTASANFIGKIFFDVLRTKCFILKPQKVCTKWSWMGKCQHHEYRKQAHVRENVPYHWIKWKRFKKRERRMFENILFLEMSIPILRDVIVYREYSMMGRSVIFGQQITDKSSHPLWPSEWQNDNT